MEACAPGVGYSRLSGDCDDAETSINPGRTELCDDVDNDCDGVTDEDDAADATVWYGDADGDGYGGTTLSLIHISSPRD